MREAMIVWGGWMGHEPDQAAKIVSDMLTEHGFKVRVETSTKAFADPAIADLSLIVPIITDSEPLELMHQGQCLFDIPPEHATNVVLLTL